jgi:hypothetical protein
LTEVEPQRREQLPVQVEAEMRRSVPAARIALADPPRDIGDEARVG